MQKQTREVRYLGAINLFYFAPFEYTKTNKQTMCKNKELTLRNKQVSLLQIFLIGVFLGPKTVQLKQTKTQEQKNKTNSLTLYLSHRPLSLSQGSAVQASQQRPLPKDGCEVKRCEEIQT